MTIKYGMGFYDSEAYVHTKNAVMGKLCHLYLRMVGFKPVR